MSDNDPALLSRRTWIGRASSPVLAASIGAGLLGARSAEAQAAESAATDLGARIYNVRAFGAKGDGKAVDTAALQNVRFQVAEADLRPAVIFDHVQGASVRGLSVQGNREAESVVRFIDSKDVLMSGTHLLTPSAPFLQIEGAANEGITLEGGDVSKATAPVAYKNGASETSVKLRV